MMHIPTHLNPNKVVSGVVRLGNLGSGLPLLLLVPAAAAVRVLQDSLHLLTSYSISPEVRMWFQCGILSKSKLLLDPFSSVPPD